ncbi:MAG: BNR repeat-containing protein [Phycisphaeraceae bacterium]
MRSNVFIHVQRTFACVAFVVLLLLGSVSPASAERAELVKAVDVEPVWTAHRVGFALLTHGDQQFVGYYDAQRRMTIAQRELGTSQWTYQKLDRVTGWDSHNYITMAVDVDEQLHVTGDMHNDPLFYLRTTKPLDITTLEQVPNMVGPEREHCVTYPRFIQGPSGELIFRYRDGGSGRGDDYYNVYHPDMQVWTRLVDEPLITGKGVKSAYATSPTLGPDGYFHMTWVWRDTSDASTNHHLSYARSRDLRNWTTAAGAPLKLPITFESCEVVDPVPSGGGMINGNTRLGFDHHDRVIISYHKYDQDGNTQIYNARFEDDAWKIYQTSDWDYRWEFGGGGSIPFRVRIGNVRPVGNGHLVLRYNYPGGSGRWLLDEKTLRPIPGRTGPPPTAPLPRALTRVTSDFPGMNIVRANDLGSVPDPRTRYLLTWEALGPNRDHPRGGDLPAPVMLRLIELQDPAGAR